MKLLNKPPFRRGDVVRCVSGWGELLKVGSEYTVVAIRREYDSWFMDIGDGQGLGWWPERFVKVSEENNSETVERR